MRQSSRICRDLALATGISLIAMILAVPPSLADRVCVPKAIPVDSRCPATKTRVSVDKIVTDGFEARKDLDGAWCTNKLVGDSINKNYALYPPAEGKGALFLTIRRGDRAEDGSQPDPADDSKIEEQCNERDEITERTWPRIRQPIAYEFSLYVPADLPRIDRRLVLAQIKQEKKKSVEIAASSAAQGTPPFSFRLVQIPGKDTLCFFTKTAGNDPTTSGQVLGVVQMPRADAVGRWHRVVMRFFVDPKDGTKPNASRAEWSFDGNEVRPLDPKVKPVLGYSPDLYDDSTYFKMGPYRDQSPPPANGKPGVEPWTFGYDAFRRLKWETTKIQGGAPIPPEVIAACTADEQARPMAWD